MVKHFNPSEQKVMALWRDICSCSIIFIALNSNDFKSPPFPDHNFECQEPVSMEGEGRRRGLEEVGTASQTVADWAEQDVLWRSQ